MMITSRLVLGLVALLGLVAPASAQVVPQPKLGEPVQGLTPAQDDLFDQGKIQFQRDFSVPEGLGPGFNQTGCASCHNSPTVGGSGATSVTRFGFVEKGMPFDPLAGDGGSLLQEQAISAMCQETVPAGANVTTFRITTSTFGLGLLEAIADSDLIANENVQAMPGSPVSGLVHWVPMLENPPPMGPLRAGRFGWKAQLATVLSFSGDATLNEMGITNSLVPDENAPNGDPATLASCDTVPDPEDVPDMMGVTFIERVTDFQRLLAAPPQTPRSGMAGEAVFQAIGCAGCHTPSYTTGAAPEAALTGQTIRPYSDFLLHDMGALGDGIVQGDALETEMRTPPLWGVRWRDPLLHDGRVAAGTVETRMVAAINEHGGEATFSRDNFDALTLAEQNQLLAFLNSLGRHEFDHDDNIFIDYADFADFWACFTGPGSFYTADDPCAIHDVDQDGDVDEDDFQVFEQVYEGAFVDCDSNLVADMEELVAGTALDCDRNAVIDSCDIALGATDVNTNGVIDSCEIFRRGDCNADGDQNIADAVFALDVLFGGNGTVPTCLDSCDNNDDGAHDIADPIYLLSHLFSQQPAPPAPYPDCGFDGDDSDSLSCSPTPFCP